MLTLTNDFTRLLIIQFFVPVKKSKKRKGNQNNKADSNKHMSCEGCKIQSLEMQLKTQIKNQLLSYNTYREKYSTVYTLEIINK